MCDSGSSEGEQDPDCISLSSVEQPPDWDEDDDDQESVKSSKSTKSKGKIKAKSRTRKQSVEQQELALLKQLSPEFKLPEETRSAPAPAQATAKLSKADEDMEAFMNHLRRTLMHLPPVARMDVQEEILRMAYARSRECQRSATRQPAFQASICQTTTTLQPIPSTYQQPSSFQQPSTFQQPSPFMSTSSLMPTSSFMLTTSFQPSGFLQQLQGAGPSQPMMQGQQMPPVSDASKSIPWDPNCIPSSNSKSTGSRFKFYSRGPSSTINSSARATFKSSYSYSRE